MNLEVVNVDALDRSVLGGLRETPALIELATAAEAVVTQPAALIQDLSATFWKENPVLNADSDSRVALNRIAVEAIMRHPDTAELREMTVYDSFATAMAVQAIGEKALAVIEQFEEPDPEPPQNSDPGEEEAQTGNGQPDGTTGDSAAAQRRQRQAEVAMSQAIRSAVSGELEERKEERAAAAAWGIEPGELQRMDFAERAELAKSVQRSHLASYIPLIGRFRMTARSNMAKKVEFGRDELYNVTLTGDLAEVLPSELSNLADPDLEWDFLIRLAEGRLLSKKWRGKQRAGDGPIIALLDTSGSMRGDREAWSKAFILSLMEVAEKDRRLFSTLVFASSKNCLQVDGTSIQSRMEVGEAFFGGGTDFDVPFGKAIDMLNHSGREKSDFVIITDGECDMRPETWAAIEQAKADGLRIFGIAVGYTAGPVLDRLCDNVRSIHDFTDTTQVADIYQIL